ncbi:hypothetical protein GIB67_028984, partial [Kingdonia uniflora]
FLHGPICLKPVTLKSWVAQQRRESFVLVFDHHPSTRDVSCMKIPPWVYLAKRIESDLLASIEHLRNEMASGECKEVLKPAFVARHFAMSLFEIQPSTNETSFILNKMPCLKNTLIKYPTRGAYSEMIISALKSPSAAINTIIKTSGVEVALAQVNRLFHTTMPTSYVEYILSEVVPKIGVDFNEEKKFYYVKVFLSIASSDFYLSWQSLTKTDQVQLFPVNAVSWKLVESLNLIRQVYIHNQILIDEDMHSLRNLIKSAVIDPEANGGLRWPSGKEYLGDRYSILGGPMIKFSELQPQGILNTLKLKTNQSIIYDASNSRNKDMLLLLMVIAKSEISRGLRSSKRQEEEQRLPPRILARDRLSEGIGTHNPQPPRQATQVTRQYVTQEHIDQRIKELIEAQAQGNKDDLTKLQGSPISKDLFDIEVPKGFHTLKIRKYRGTNPKEHIQQYRDSLRLYSNLNHILCRLFATSLQGEPLRWFHSLPEDSILTFDQLQKLLEYIFKDGRMHEYIIDLESDKNGSDKMQIEVVQVEDQAEEKYMYHMYHNIMIEIYQINNSCRFKCKRLSECYDLTPQDKEAKLLPESNNRQLGISFKDCDISHAKFPHYDALVIMLKIKKFVMHTMMIDTESGIEILF